MQLGQLPHGCLFFFLAGPPRSPFLNKYILYSKTMYYRFKCINLMFPKFNELSNIDSKDWSAVATSPAECWPSPIIFTS